MDGVTSCQVEEVQTQLLVGKQRDLKVIGAGAQIMVISVVSHPPLGAIKRPLTPAQVLTPGCCHSGTLGRMRVHK